MVLSNSTTNKHTSRDAMQILTAFPVEDRCLETPNLKRVYCISVVDTLPQSNHASVSSDFLLPFSTRVLVRLPQIYQTQVTQRQTVTFKIKFEYQYQWQRDFFMTFIDVSLIKHGTILGSLW